MSKIIVATNPVSDDDDMLKYLDSWHGEVVSLAKKQENTLIFELNGERANKEALTELVKEKSPRLIIINGHGNYDSVFGFSGGVLIRAGENEDILVNTIVHSLTCSSGKILGPCCIKIGALAYIGYKEEFKITYLKNQNTKEAKLNDKIASLFLDPAFEAIFSLVKGRSVGEAFNDSQRKYLQNLKFSIADNNPGLNTAVAPRLYHNFINQVCLGEGGARF